MGGAIGGGFGDHSTLLHRLLVAASGGIRVRLDAQSAEPFAQLTGRECRCVLDHLIHDPAGSGLVEVGGGAQDDAGAGPIDRPAVQGFPDPGEATAKPDGEVQSGICAAAGEPQRRADLGGCGVPRQFGVVGELGGVDVVRDRRHGREHPGLEMRRLPGQSPEDHHPVVSRHPIHIDRRQEPAQHRARRHLIEPRRDRPHTPAHIIIEHTFDTTAGLRQIPSSREQVSRAPREPASARSTRAAGAQQEMAPVPYGTLRIHCPRSDRRVGQSLSVSVCAMKSPSPEDDPVPPPACCCRVRHAACTTPATPNGRSRPATTSRTPPPRRVGRNVRTATPGRRPAPRPWRPPSTTPRSVPRSRNA